jgi:hypothetical protein
VLYLSEALVVDNLGLLFLELVVLYFVFDEMDSELAVLAWAPPLVPLVTNRGLLFLELVVLYFVFDEMDSELAVLAWAPPLV